MADDFLLTGGGEGTKPPHSLQKAAGMKQL